jgi:hypothetical protein
VTCKKDTGHPCKSYDGIVDQRLCFGWMVSDDHAYDVPDTMLRYRAMSPNVFVRFSTNPRHCR